MVVESIQMQLGEFMGVMLLFLPVLFGAVEFIKAKGNLTGGAVEALSIGLFVVYGVLAVVAVLYPSVGTLTAAVGLFLLMCALAPSGYYKFIAARTAKRGER